jgi:DNA-binding transcriptional ArsR family regulator
MHSFLDIWTHVFSWRRLTTEVRAMTATAGIGETDAMAAVLARLERLEQLVGVQAAEAAGRATAAADPERHGPTAHASFNAWLRGAAQRGVVLVVGGVAHGDGHLSASLVRFDRGEGTSRDWRAIAEVCHALGSEARLGLLRELERGPRTTGELLTAVGLDRGQLYHHLRDLLLQGFVEQPERGRYAITRRGERAFLLSCLLPSKEPPAPDDAALDLGEPGAAAPPETP